MAKKKIKEVQKMVNKILHRKHWATKKNKDELGCSKLFGCVNDKFFYMKLLLSNLKRNHAMLNTQLVQKPNTVWDIALSCSIYI